MPQGSDKKLCVYVQNRIAYILLRTDLNNWKWVPSALNPADVGSRGVTPDSFHKDMSFWQSGPDFLHHEPIDPPFEQPSLSEVHATLLTMQEASLLPAQIDSVFLTRLLDHFSNFTLLLKIIVHFIRRVNSCVSSSPIDCSELRSAELMLIKYEQRLIVVRNFQHYSAQGAC